MGQNITYAPCSGINSQLLAYFVVEWTEIVDGAKPCSSSRKPTGDLLPLSPRRVLPRFVNPRIGSKPLRFFM
jgi:hypothetical protein